MGGKLKLVRESFDVGIDRNSFGNSVQLPKNDVCGFSSRSRTLRNFTQSSGNSSVELLKKNDSGFLNITSLRPK